MRWRPTSPATRTQSHITPLPEPLFTCIFWKRDVKELWCPSGGGSSRDCNWRVIRRRIWNRNGRRGWGGGDVDVDIVLGGTIL